jgi:uncharacterized RDD family membrane protein YckC
MKFNMRTARWLGLGLGLTLGFWPPVMASPQAEDSAATGSLSGRDGAAGGDRVRITGNSEVSAGEKVGDFVVVFGNATLHGEVTGDMVVVFGNATVDGTVQGDCVNVMGSMRLGPNADVHGQCVAIGGKLNRDPGAKLAREPVEVGFGGLMPQVEGLGRWVREGLLLGRPLPPTVGFVWWIVGLHFLVYLIITLLLPKPVDACVKVLETRTLTAFMVGLLGMILLAPVMFILVVSGIGLLIVPFVALALTAAKLIGRTACFHYIGGQLLHRANPESAPTPLVAFLVGWVLVTLLYMVPILGFVVLGVLTPFSLGAALLAVFHSRRNGQDKPAPSLPLPTPAPLAPLPTLPAAPTLPPAAVPLAAAPLVAETPPPAAPVVAPMAVFAEPATAPGSTASAPPSVAGPVPPLPGPAPQPGPVPPFVPTAAARGGIDFTRLPRAGFWLRFAAVLLDLILVGIVTDFIVPHLPVFRYVHRDFSLSIDNPVGLLIWLGYHVGMWVWRGTTIGGIVCNLKVVRLDGRPMDVGVALVRGLGSIFSFLALGIGFFWAGWSSERQSWHDKIAGTTIVKVPKGIPLI